ncbi:uncharacterized protein LOC128198745 [Bicyclus anynana]|uniref:Uncharacterized protein LOC128198745 n=1 Tax=Bicyclus anynana TaxID=110368 RepID=A0ABM3LQZ1_BICAN|nr:uncharacterized protein LOC128198745 [Bicyclus anynana]
MLVMKELGKRAKFPDYVAIQYIIDGIEDCQTNKIVLYGVTTYPALKGAVKQPEASPAQIRATSSATVEPGGKYQSAMFGSVGGAAECTSGGGHVEHAPLQLKLVLKDDVPVAQRPRKLSHMEQCIVEKQIDEGL